MNTKLLKIVTCIGLMLSSIITFAVPANQNPITIKQPNNKMLTFILKGDEYVHWANTLDGYTILPNKEGHYVYAILNDKNDLICSSILACNENERSTKEKAFLK